MREQSWNLFDWIENGKHQAYPEHNASGVLIKLQNQRMGKSNVRQSARTKSLSQKVLSCILNTSKVKVYKDWYSIFLSEGWGCVYVEEVAFSGCTFRDLVGVLLGLLEQHCDLQRFVLWIGLQMCEWCMHSAVPFGPAWVSILLCRCESGQSTLWLMWQ